MKQAQSVIDYRRKNNGIKNRQELLKIKGIGQIAYKNACGFLRILPDTLQDVIVIDDVIFFVCVMSSIISSL